MAENQEKGEIVFIQKGALIKFQFRGYSGQIQEFKGLVDSVSTDSVYLKENKLIRPASFRIAAADIIGFRGYSPGRNFSKVGLQIALTGANLIFYYGVVAGSFATGPAILISMGTGLLSYGIIRLLYPEKIKKTTQSGWSFKIVSRTQ